jgi:ribonuclease HII
METTFTAGIDEAGRGPLAGPVTAAAVVLPDGFSHPEITDSKKLSAETRERLFDEIVAESLAFSVVSVGPRRIERLNIRRATQLAMHLAAQRVARSLHGQYRTCSVNFLVDGNFGLPGNELASEPIIKGDETVLVISAASVLAKVTRDRLMANLAQKYPRYEFELHKGYPTARHLELIRVHGACQIHRRTFRGVVQECVQQGLWFGDEYNDVSKRGPMQMG